MVCEIIADTAEDGVMWLTDPKFDDFLEDLPADFQPGLFASPAMRHRRRIIYPVLLPTQDN